MKSLIFPPLEAGRGEHLNLRVSYAQGNRLKLEAMRCRVFGREDGVPSVAALIRAIGEGEILLSRKDAPAGAPGKAEVHRGCPQD